MTTVWMVNGKYMNGYDKCFITSLWDGFYGWLAIYDGSLKHSDYITISHQSYSGVTSSHPRRLSSNNHPYIYSYSYKPYPMSGTFPKFSSISGSRSFLKWGVFLVNHPLPGFSAKFSLSNHHPSSQKKRAFPMVFLCFSYGLGYPL